MSVPDGWIDPPEDLVEEGEEAYRKWEESLGPLPELEELEAEPCEPEDSEEPAATLRCKHCKAPAEALGPVGMWQHCPDHEGGALVHEWGAE